MAVWLLVLILTVSVPSIASSDLSQTNSTCLDCHSDYADNLSKTVHRFNPRAADSKLRLVYCTNCHGDAAKHLEEPSAENIVNPAKSKIFDLVKTCSACHASAHVREFSETNIHFRQNVSCLNCHSIHQAKAEALLLMPSVSLCLSCHAEIEQKLANPFRHPVNDRVVKCIDCHQISLQPGKSFSSTRPDQSCFGCHAEFQGPFVFEHGATQEYSIEKAGCVSCHDPHGSTNPRLLLQPVKQLCRQCHDIPKHRTAHGGIYANRNCLECHTDIHGSYTDRRFFNESALAQNCFLVGCHGS